MDHGVRIPSYAAVDGRKRSIELYGKDRIIEFYEEAGIDYAHWSRNLNMHIGFFRRGMNPFDRESMLEQLNLEVADRLRIDAGKQALLLDLGCGMGAVARTVAKQHPNARVKGVTLSPSQVRIASAANAAAGLGDRIEILKEDFTRLSFEDATADGAFAVESSCYAPGADKRDLVREMRRVLRPGAPFVVVDCFVKRPDKKFDPVTKWSYRRACRNWAVAEMPQLEYFVAALTKHGFRDLTVEDISWRAAVSVAHAPFAVASFLLKKFLSGKKPGRHSLNNLTASLLTVPIGLSRSKFSYCIISGKRG